MAQNIEPFEDFDLVAALIRVALLTQNINWDQRGFDFRIEEQYPVDNVLVHISATDKKLPMVSIHTIKNTPLLSFWFEGVMGHFRQHEREKDAVMGLPRDYSMMTAVRIYVEMRAGIMTFMREHEEQYVGVQMTDPD